MMNKIQIGDCEVREDLLYAYLQAVENVEEGRDTWRLDTVRATHHHALLKSLGLAEDLIDKKYRRNRYRRDEKKYKEFVDALSIWIEKQIEKDRRALDGNFRQ